MRCWGFNQYGQLGYGNTTYIGDTEVPSSVGTVSVGGNVDELALSYDNTCVRIGTDVKCWGYGPQGQLGYANGNIIGDDEAPSTAGSVSYF